MSTVLLELSVSVDGFVTGPEIGPDAPLGIGGERLHDWMFAGKSASDSETFETAHFSEIGALVLGRGWPISASVRGVRSQTSTLLVSWSPIAPPKQS